MSGTISFALFGGIAAFVAISLLVSLIIIKVFSDMAEHSQLSKGSVRDVQRDVLIMWLVLTVIWILQGLGLTSLLSSLTLSGIVGIGVTLAFQSTFSNILCGIWLLRDNMLRLGDNIKILGLDGTVIKLGFRSTWLKTSDGNIVVMSNLTLYNGPFTNFTATERLSGKFENMK
jgi:MscS family membrane protein